MVHTFMPRFVYGTPFKLTEKCCTLVYGSFSLTYSSY